MRKFFFEWRKVQVEHGVTYAGGQWAWVCVGGLLVPAKRLLPLPPPQTRMVKPKKGKGNHLLTGVLIWYRFVCTVPYTVVFAK